VRRTALIPLNFISSRLKRCGFRRFRRAEGLKFKQGCIRMQSMASCDAAETGLSPADKASVFWQIRPEMDAGSCRGTSACCIITPFEADTCLSPGDRAARCRRSDHLHLMKESAPSIMLYTCFQKRRRIGHFDRFRQPGQRFCPIPAFYQVLELLSAHSGGGMASTWADNHFEDRC